MPLRSSAVARILPTLVASSLAWSQSGSAAPALHTTSPGPHARAVGGRADGGRARATLPASSATSSGDGGGIVRRADGWLRGDLHFHTNYSGDALDQGGDWVGPAFRIAEYYQDAEFVAAFPEYQGNQLDFIALTDHRTTDGCYDPDFQSDKLTLICGEEFGSTGHAGALHITDTISSDPADGRTANEQIQWAIDEAGRQGGWLSPNHPVGDDDMWFWDVSGYASAEVWNMFWTFLAPPTDESVLDNHVAEYGVENRFIRRAVRQEGQGLGGQYLAFYEGHLVAGLPLAAVGGGDRHMLVMPGHPTTYVQADETTPEGLKAGVLKRRTFVSRSPAGPQVLLGARAGDLTYTVGDAIPAGQTITLTAEVGRADHGRLRIITGPIIRDVTQEQLLAMDTLGEVLFDVPVTSNDFTWEGTWTPSGEAWVYAQVLESTDDSSLPADVQDDLDALRRSMEFYGMRYGQLVYSLLPFIDVEDLLLPATCDPAEWNVYETVCVESDDVYMGTIHIPEHIDRILNLYREDDRQTDYAMGAITSPITVER